MTIILTFIVALIFFIFSGAIFTVLTMVWQNLIEKERLCFSFIGALALMVSVLLFVIVYNAL